MTQLIRHAPDAPLLLGPEGEVAAGAFLTQARALAAALPSTRYVVNLCESRHGFMLGFAAALMRGRTSLFPPGQGRGDLDLVLRGYADACILLDAPRDAAFATDIPAIDVSPYRASAAICGDAAPEIDANLAAAILFTSGSTGQPAAHAKTWGQLCHGADALGAALGWRASAPGALVGSVPSQHMFGLETTVMLPWRHGIAVHHHKPLLPADLEQALEDCGRRAWWMTTPVHLRAPLKQPAALPHLEGVVASTMSLPVALAAAAESAWQVPVMEIYGATETGALALRRTARETWWSALPGVALQRRREEGIDGGAASGAIWAEGAHVGAPVRLADELELGADGRFRWLGRATDLVKVAGKRASLAALNHHLTELPGVEDAVYFLPSDEHATAGEDVHAKRSGNTQGVENAAARAPTTSDADASGPHRLAAFYVSATLDPRDVLQLLRERVDPVFLPRPLYRVDALPRNATGKLLQSALAALLAQCRSRGSARVEGEENASAAKHAPAASSSRDTSTPAAAENRESGPQAIQALHEPAGFVVLADHPALAGHFPGNPIVPGAVILARVVQALRRLFPACRFRDLANARFHEPLRPGVACVVHPALRDGIVRFEVRTMESGTLIASGQWSCPADAAP